MSESVIAWPFLVARGRHRGYRTILAPGFLTERRLHGLLSDSTSGEQMDASRAREVEVERPEVGALTLVYRTENMTEAELDGGRGDGLATDEHGRPLEMLYGIVCRGRPGGWSCSPASSPGAGCPAASTTPPWAPPDARPSRAIAASSPRRTASRST